MIVLLLVGDSHALRDMHYLINLQLNIFTERLQVVPFSLSPPCVTRKKPRDRVTVTRKMAARNPRVGIRAALFPSRFIYGLARRTKQNRYYSSTSLTLVMSRYKHIFT